MISHHIHLLSLFVFSISLHIYTDGNLYHFISPFCCDQHQLPYHLCFLFYNFHARFSQYLIQYRSPFFVTDRIMPDILHLTRIINVRDDFFNQIIRNGYRLQALTCFHIYLKYSLVGMLWEF